MMGQKALALLINLCLVNMCMFQEECDYCDFKEDNCCNGSRWGMKEYFADEIFYEYASQHVTCKRCDSSCVHFIETSCGTNVWAMKYNEIKGMDV